MCKVTYRPERQVWWRVCQVEGHKAWVFEGDMRVYVLAALVFEHLMPGKGVWGGEGGTERFPLLSGHLSAWQEGSCYTQCRFG